MRDSIVENKIKIFISSSQSQTYKERFSIVKKSLKLLLEETNLFLVYAFEAANTCSSTVEESYLNQLENSSIVLFLIDNKDGVPEGVFKEHKKAIEQQKKCLYIFNDEFEKKPTTFQQEIGTHYGKVSNFDDFVYKGYISIIQELTDFYLFSNIDDSKKEEFTQKPINANVVNYKMEKELINGYYQTENEMIKDFFQNKNELNTSSSIDKLSANFLRIILGKERFNEDIFAILKQTILDSQSDCLKELLSIRFDAIKDFFNDNLDGCLQKLLRAFDANTKNDKIPSWLINDILIDLRNIELLINEKNNKLLLPTKGQELLDESSEALYYPLLDRYNYNFQEDIMNLFLNLELDSPYTTRFGGINEIFKLVTSSYIVALSHGSLTQLLLTKDRLIDCLLSVSFVVNNHSILFELIRLLLITQKEKNLEKLLRVNKLNVDVINDTNINSLLLSVNTICISHKKQISNLILFRFFGYYFSEEEYKKSSEAILRDFHQWIIDDKRIMVLSTYYFNAIKENIYRLNNNKIIDLILLVFNNDLKRWFDNCFELIQVLNFTKITNNRIESIAQFLLIFVKEENSRKSCHHLAEALIVIRKVLKRKLKTYDNCIKMYMVNFYNSTYSMEVSDKNDDDSMKHINRYLLEIKKRNAEYENSKERKGYLDDLFGVIRNIIEFDKVVLNRNHLKSIIDMIKVTIFSTSQLYSNKVNAIRLLYYLKNKYWRYKSINDAIEMIIIDENNVYHAYDDLFFKESHSTLKFSVSLLKILVSKKEHIEILYDILLSNQNEDYVIISYLMSFYSLFDGFDFQKLDKTSLSLIVQFVINMSYHKELEIRTWSVMNFSFFINTSFKSLILKRMSSMIDNDVFKIKIRVLNIIKNSNLQNEEYAKHIIQKTKIDNHYMIRKFTEENFN